MPLSLQEAEKVYENQIAAKQSELGELESEIGKQRIHKDALESENNKLVKEIDKNKDQIVSLIDQIKAKELAFSESSKNSLASLMKRDAESDEREKKSLASNESSKLLEVKLAQAKNQLLSIAQDFSGSISKLSSQYETLKKSVEQEVQPYLALKEAAAEIPVLPKLKK